MVGPLILEAMINTMDGSTGRLFKANLLNDDWLAEEIVAFSNSRGGTILIGVNGEGVVTGLSADDVRRINPLLSSAASLHVHPPISLFTENVAHANGVVIVVSVPEGVSKPYMDKNGVVWVKSGADKRRATSREEMQRMFQQAGLIHADETPVPGIRRCRPVLL